MKIALVSEGTYPFAMGGVSVWCDQLISGMPEHEVEFVALTVDERQEQLWPSPANLTSVRVIPLWTTQPPVHHGVSSSGARAVDDLLRELARPMVADAPGVAAGVDRFLDALRRCAGEAQRRGGTAGLFTTNRAVGTLCQAWLTETGTRLSLHEALEWGDVLEHLLRPLGVEVVHADVVHSSMNGPSMLVGLLAKWTHGTPVLMSEHGIYQRERYLLNEAPGMGPRIGFLRLSLFRLLAAASYRVADALAPHSLYNRRWQLINGADPARMHTMYNGVAVEDFRLATTEPDVPTVSFLGRIDPVKDVRNLITAFAQVHATLPQARLRIFGGAPKGQEDYLQGCHDLIAELGLTGSATLEGPTAHPELGYHAGTVVALSSISEGFPFSIVEAMACGRAIVCTNVGGVAEAVGDAGLVVPPRDSQALGAALTKILLDDELRHGMARAARQRVVDSFTVGQWVRAYTHLYEILTMDSQETAPDADTDPPGAESVLGVLTPFPEATMA